jgi:hypothetical protein
MLKRLALLVGLVSVGFGLRLIALEYSQNASCNASYNLDAGAAARVKCMNIAGAYFGGFTMVVLGLVAVLLGLMVARKSAQNRATPREPKPDLASRYADPSVAGRERFNSPDS